MLSFPRVIRSAVEILKEVFILANKKIKSKTIRKIAPKSRQKTKKNTPISSAIDTPGIFSENAFLSLSIGVVLIGLAFLQVDAFSWFETPFKFLSKDFNFLLILGLALSAYGLRGLPASGSKMDLPRWVAYPILVFLFILGAYLRLYRLDQPIGDYWDDPAGGLTYSRNVLDLHAFYILFPVGALEPLYPYFVAFIWWLVPTWKAIFVQRFALSLLNLLGVWFFYRIGREVSGKRLVGLLLVAFMVASKPIVFQTISMLSGATLVFGVGLITLFQVRVFKKPDLWHFIQWGIVFALGLCCYNAIRTWVPFFAVVTLGWILWKSRKETTTWPVRIVIFFFAVGFLSFFLDKMLSVGHDNFISRAFGGTFANWVFSQVLFLGALIYCYKSSGQKGKLLCSWALGLLVAGVLSYPLAMLPDAAQRITNISLLPKNSADIFTFKFLSFMIGQAQSAIKTFFIWGDDRADMNVVGDPFLDYHATVFVIVGLVWAAVRPTWWKTLLFCCAWVGIVPRLLTQDPHSGKLLGALPVLLLLSAMAFGQWIESAWDVSQKKRWMGILLIISLVLFWGWEVDGTFRRAYEKWWYVTGPDSKLSREIMKDMPEKRIYLVPAPGGSLFSPKSQSVLEDSQPLYNFQDVNAINVYANKTRKDVVVFVSPVSKVVVDKLKKEYPLAQWSPILQYYQTADEKVPFAYRVLIPTAQISEKPGKIFFFSVISNETWIRRIYLDGFGMARGMIDVEDASPTLNPVSQLAGGQCVSADGEWDAPADGRYIFSVNSPNFVQLWVDGKLLIDSKPAINKVGKEIDAIDLKKGPHAIRYVSYLKVQLLFADVTIRNPELKFEQILGSH